MESESDALDALLEAALERYSPQPRPGIEQRVLYRVRAEQRRRRLWIWAFAVAVPVLIVGALAMFVGTRPAPRVEHARVSPAKARELPVQVVRTAAVRKPAPKRVRVPAVPFPTPTPLTGEEIALQQLAAKRPLEAQQFLVREDLKPIEIREIEIAPLQSDGGR